MVMWPSLQSVWALSLWEAPLERILKPSWLFAKSWHLRGLNHWKKTTYDALQVAASQLPKKICAFLMSHILWSRCCYWNFTGWPNRWWISRAAQRKPPMSSKVGRNLAITWTPWPQMLPATQGQAIEAAIGMSWGATSCSLPTSSSQSARNSPEAQWLVGTTRDEWMLPPPNFQITFSKLIWVQVFLSFMGCMYKPQINPTHSKHKWYIVHTITCLWVGLWNSLSVAIGHRFWYVAHLHNIPSFQMTPAFPFWNQHMCFFVVFLRNGEKTIWNPPNHQWSPQPCCTWWDWVEWVERKPHGLHATLPSHALSLGSTLRANVAAIPPSLDRGFLGGRSLGSLGSSVSTLRLEDFGFLGWLGRSLLILGICILLGHLLPFLGRLLHIPSLSIVGASTGGPAHDSWGHLGPCPSSTSISPPSPEVGCPSSSCSSGVVVLDFPFAGLPLLFAASLALAFCLWPPPSLASTFPLSLHLAAGGLTIIIPFSWAKCKLGSSQDLRFYRIGR